MCTMYASSVRPVGTSIEAAIEAEPEALRRSLRP